MNTTTKLTALVLLLGAGVACARDQHRIERHYEQDTTTVETHLPDGTVQRDVPAADGQSHPPRRRVVVEETVSAPEIVVE